MDFLINLRWTTVRLSREVYHSTGMWGQSCGQPLFRIFKSPSPPDQISTFFFFFYNFWHLDWALCRSRSHTGGLRGSHFNPKMTSWSHPSGVQQSSCVCLYAGTHSHSHTGIWRKAGVSVASPVTCQSVSVPDAPSPPPPSACQRGGLTGDKAGVTDSDREVIPPVGHGQGGASPCVNLSDRVESWARGGTMQLLDRGLV